MSVYTAHHQIRQTGTTYTRGADLYAHTAQSGKVYFYVHRWSLWQGEEGSLRIVSKNKAEDFLTEKMALTGWGALDEEDAESISEKYGLELLNEMA